MSDSDVSTGAAPQLGDPTDADLDEEVLSAALDSGRHHSSGDETDAADAEKTIDTPDELGGTGGEQAGGAG